MMIATPEAPALEMAPVSPVVRDCGAACLSVVYRTFGREVTRTEIWPAIAKQNRFGSISSTTHLMAKDALSRGLAALAIQVRHPLQALRLCRDSGIRAILNHRLKPDLPTGHYTVLLDIDDKHAIVYDPFFDSSRCLAHAELLELWQPLVSGSEIVGNVLIGVAVEPTSLPACQVCGAAIEPVVECPRCKKAVSLQPSVLIGCMSEACIARMWNYLCCPSCDYTWTFSMSIPSAAASASNAFNDPDRPASSRPSPMDLHGAAEAEHSSSWMNACFGALEQFCAHIRSTPAAANHAAIKQYLEALAASKTRIKLAESERLVYQKIARDQLADLQAATELKRQAHQKRIEELNRPSPPLDGDALGRALLKNLGFVE